MTAGLGLISTCLNGFGIVAALDNSALPLQKFRNAHDVSLSVIFLTAAVASLLPVSTIRGTRLTWFTNLYAYTAIVQLAASWAQCIWPTRIKMKGFEGDLVNDLVFLNVAVIMSPIISGLSIWFTSSFTGKMPMAKDE